MYLSIPPQVTPRARACAPACALHSPCAPHHVRPIQILEILKFFKFSFFVPVTLFCLSPKVSQHVPLSVASCMALCVCCCVRAVCDAPHTKYMRKGNQLSFRHAVTLGFATLHPFYTHMGAQMPPLITPCAPRVSAHAQLALANFGDFLSFYAPAIQVQSASSTTCQSFIYFSLYKTTIIPPPPVNYGGSGVAGRNFEKCDVSALIGDDEMSPNTSPQLVMLGLSNFGPNNIHIGPLKCTTQNFLCMAQFDCGLTPPPLPYKFANFAFF